MGIEVYFLKDREMEALLGLRPPRSVLADALAAARVDRLLRLTPPWPCTYRRSCARGSTRGRGRPRRLAKGSRRSG